MCANEPCKMNPTALHVCRNDQLIIIIIAVLYSPVLCNSFKLPLPPEPPETYKKPRRSKQI